MWLSLIEFCERIFFDHVNIFRGTRKPETELRPIWRCRFIGFMESNGIEFGAEYI